MDNQTVMQGVVVLAIVLLIVGFVCELQGISAGVFLFILAFILGLIVIDIRTLWYFRPSWRRPMDQPGGKGSLLSERVDDLKMRYAKGESTAEYFRQMKKDLDKQSSGIFLPRK